MKKTRVNWINDNDEIYFSEVIFECELPRIGESVIYMKGYFIITHIERNFDEKLINITIQQQ